MRCEHCGCEVNMQTLRCTACGASILDDMHSAAQTQPQSSEQRQKPQQKEAASAQQTTGQQKNEQRQSKGLLARADAILAPFADRILEKYYAKMPKMNRAKDSRDLDRMVIYAIALGILVLIVVVVLVIILSQSPAIVGRWTAGTQDVQSDSLTFEFTSKGEVNVYVKALEGELLYKSGSYSTRRDDGRNLLEIRYSDGSVSTLYYEIDGKEGEFTNAQSGAVQTWHRR